LEIYFDNAATTRVCDEAAQMAVKAMTELYGNPSSLHNKGLEIEKEMKNAREKVAKAWGVTPAEVYFTSCATESNNMAIRGAIKKGKKWGNKVITTKAEHPAVLEVLEHCRETMGIEIIYLDLDRGGKPDLEMLERVTDEKVILFTMMHVNNETGVIMPVKEAVSIVKRKAPRAFTHSDMVQSFGKTGVSATSLGVDFASISGHKFHGPLFTPQIPGVVVVHQAGQPDAVAVFHTVECAVKGKQDDISGDQIQNAAAGTLADPVGIGEGNRIAAALTGIEPGCVLQHDGERARVLCLLDKA